jgi:hypothetical protein
MAAAAAAHTLAAMSTLAIILIAVAAVFVLLLVGGFAGAARRRSQHGEHYNRNLAAADRALEHARAADKGWDRPALEAVARDALASDRPDWSYSQLVLVLVDDRPGVSEDCAHFVASGSDGEARVVLARRESGWALERLE